MRSPTRGVCGAKLRSADEWRAHPQGIALAQVPVVEILRLGDAAPNRSPGPRAGEHGARPLSGVRVLDLTRVLAGPTCARTLAEHGAEVLHVRSPKLPSIEPFVIDTNPGKRSCYLDLDRKEDVERMRALVRDAHVFSQGYRPGALARRGFSPEGLAEMRPGIIVVSIDCYGHEGPFARPTRMGTTRADRHRHGARARRRRASRVGAGRDQRLHDGLPWRARRDVRARATRDRRRQLARSRIAGAHCDVDHVVAAHRAGCKAGRIRHGIDRSVDHRDEHRLGTSNASRSDRAHVENAAAMGSSACSARQRSAAWR